MQRNSTSATIWLVGCPHCNGYTELRLMYTEALKLHEESQVTRLGFFGFWAYSIPSCEIQQVHSHLKVLFRFRLKCLWQPFHLQSLFIPAE